MTKSPIRLPDKIRIFLSQLNENGHRAYVVGGAVRDLLLGLEPYDFDIATSATPGQIKETFKYLAKVKQIDASFPVVEVDGIEIASFRKDVYRNGVTISTVRVDNLETDLARRDLTVNAMALDRDGELYDPFNGRYDLQNKLIRFVGEDTSETGIHDLINAEKRIEEDPCRMLRACRFRALLDGEFTSETKTALQHKAYLLKQVPKERIRLEILKAMQYKNASTFFIALHEIKVLDEIFPSLEACFAKDHGQYHDEDIFTHMMIAGDYAFAKMTRHCKNTPIFRLTCFLHDVGKSEPNMKDGEIHFYDHEYKGADFLKVELKALKFTTAEIKYATNLVLVHMRGSVKMSPKTTRKLIKRFLELDVNWKEWLALKVCDKAANTSKEPFTNGRVQKIARKFTHELSPISSNEAKPCFTHKELAISGTHIQKLLGINASPIIGVILEHCLNRVLSEPSLNTRENLEREIIGKKKVKKQKPNSLDIMI